MARECGSCLARSWEPNVEVLDLGRLGYLPAWDRQREVAEGVVAGGPDTLILVEHDPVLTLGANFHTENLLHPEAWYRERGIEIIPTDRGGDVTYHGPGQLVIYPIFALDRHGRDLHAWIRRLEAAIIGAAASFGLEGRRFPPHTGVWVGDRKLAAIGIKVRKWVNLHGIAMNVENDLAIFDEFVPCGIQDYGVTSLSQEAGRPVTLSESKVAVVTSFLREFSS